MNRILSLYIVIMILLLIPVADLAAGEIVWRLDIESSDVNILQGEDGTAGIAVTGYTKMNYLDFPPLPYKVVSFLLPQGEDVTSFKLEGGREIVLRDDISLAPFEGEYLDDGTVRGLSAEAGEIIGADSILPKWKVRHLGTRVYRGYRIASFAIYPIRYNVDSGDLKVLKGARLVVETGYSNREDDARRVRYVEGFRERSRKNVERIVVNPAAASTYFFDDTKVESGGGGFMPSYFPSMEGSDVSYLIITNEEMAPVYQQLADWKTMKGLPAVVKTVEWIEANYRNGADLGETIRTFLKDAYSKWGVEWVVLGGDTDVIPARYGYVTFYSGEVIPTDLYYSCLDGDWNADGDSLWGEAYISPEQPGDNADVYAEVFLGRMPTSSYDEAEILVNKTINYELPADTISKGKFLLMGEVIFPSPFYVGDPIILHGAEIAENIYDNHLESRPELTTTRLYELSYLYPGSIELTGYSALDSMEAGVNHVMHVGHGGAYNMAVGNGTILNFDADHLMNGNATFSMYLMNCTNVSFDKECLAESFMLNDGGGAFAVSGSSRSAFPSISRPYLDQYYFLLLERDIVQLGKLHQMSREPFTENCTGDTGDRWTHFIYNYLGDPEVSLFRGVPKTFTVDLPASADFGPNDLTVEVSSGGSGFDSAYVCLYKEGDDYAFGYTNYDGVIHFNDFYCRYDGKIEVTVTGVDHFRYVDSIMVNTEADPFLRVEKNGIDDSVDGNGDGVLDGGETVNLALRLENTGEGDAEKIYAFISCTNPAVMITDDSALYPDLASGEKAYNLDFFTFTVNTTLDDQEFIEFTVDIHDSTGGAWSEKLAFEVHCPILETFINTMSDEPPYGNDNGIIEPGESFLLRIGVRNFGSGEAYSLSGKIRSETGNLVVTDSTSTYQDISTMETDCGEGFVLYETDMGTDNHFTLEVTDAHGRMLSKRMELREPDPPVGVWLDASLGPNEINVTWNVPDSSESYRYLVYHSFSGGGPFERVSKDLLFHTIFKADGLPASTMQYFTVVAVDSCGNLSVFSDVANAPTSAPQLPGWPQLVGKESASSPAIGDVDGDARIDVVVGSDLVYAWDAEGMELVDGDEQPITWGVLSPEGDTYTASVALGQLDGQPGLEVVAASWNTKEIYVFDHEGNTLPGWPKATKDLCWASPVLGDFDGDGDLEIFAYDVDGTVYVWHHDGTEFMDGDSNPATDGPFFSAGESGDGWHVSTPALADIDEDNKIELVVCAPKDKIYCVNSDGSPVPGWPVSLVDPNAHVGASPVVGDIDNDGHLEVVVQDSFGWVYGLNHDGTNMSGWPKWIYSNNFFAGSASLADLTGDSKLEVVIPSMNGYCYVFRYNGSILPNWPQPYADSGPTETSPLIADVDGDGSLDIVLGCEDGLLNAWDINGDYVQGFPMQLNGFIRSTPSAGDLDYDGDLELITMCWNQRVYIWDLTAGWYRGCVEWNGFHGNLYNSGWKEQITSTSGEQIAWMIDLKPGALSLNWAVIPGVVSWSLYRQENDGVYERIASNLRADEAMTIRYIDLVIEEGSVYTYKLEADDGREISVETDRIEIPVTRARLYQNYPNPFNPSTTISFTVPGSPSARKNVLLHVYDVRGALVKTLVNRAMPGGKYDINWDGSNNRGEAVSSGVYFSKLRIDAYTGIKKMILLR